MKIPLLSFKRRWAIILIIVFVGAVDLYFLVGWWIREEEKGALLPEADYRFSLEHYAAAADLYEEVLALDPDNIHSLIKLGYSYLEVEGTRKPSELFERAVELNPKKLDDLLDLAAFYREDGGPEVARDLLRAAEAAYPDEYRVYLEWGKLYRQQGETAKAEENLKRAAGMQPADSEIYYELRRLLRGGDAENSVETELSTDLSSNAIPPPVATPEGGRRTPGIGPPLVVLFSIDTLRADRMSCYGNERKTTPHIDEVARGGVLFEKAISQSSITTPSHMSLFTAFMPDIHLVECRRNPTSRRCRPR